MACNKQRNNEDQHDAPDPRIFMELEKLNSANDEINKLEKELDEARGLFRVTLSDSSSQLNALLKKHRRSIEKTRDYFQALALSKKTQCEAQHAAVQFRRASSFYKAAKETIHLAEQRLQDDDIEFDEAWQEMLNHSTIKMMEAEKEKMRSELEHHRKSQAYQDLEYKVHRLERSHRGSINKARPYYELKAHLEIQLQQQKQNVDDLQKGVAAAKLQYKTAMTQLEKISEEIHEQRKMFSLPEREPGVGCDSDDDDLSFEINLEKHLNFEASCSDDGISTDTSSIWSDTSSITGVRNPETSSINSFDYDSAICSPKSLTLERTLSDSLKLTNAAPDGCSSMIENIDEVADITLRLQQTCSTILESQQSLDYLSPCQTPTPVPTSPEEESRRGRTGTLVAS